MVGRWCITAARFVAEFFIGGSTIPEAPPGSPRRKLYGYLFSHAAPSPFKARARRQKAWHGDGRFRLGTTERNVLVSRSGWVVPSVDVGPSRRFLWWTLQTVRVDGECLTLMARRATAARWISA